MSSAISRLPPSQSCHVFGNCCATVAQRNGNVHFDLLAVLDLPALHGSITAASISEKCFTLRVAKVARCANTMPAIILSRRSPDLPAS